MVYSWDKYVLCIREDRNFYFFAKMDTKPKVGKPTDLPDGHIVVFDKKWKSPHLRDINKIIDDLRKLLKK